jgi:hypothetical protein
MPLEFLIIIAMNSSVVFGTIAIFTILILLLGERKRSFHLMCSISFFKILLENFHLGFFFKVIANVTVFLISFSVCLLQI